MATTDTERYVRITLLTFEGGTWICKKILFRELALVNGAPTLDNLLLQNKSVLKNKRLTFKQYGLLFPSSGAATDVEEWDLSLLIKVILVLFEPALPVQDKDDLNELLRIRNDVISHARQPSLRQQQFTLHWFALSTSISTIASNFDIATKLHSSELIQKLLRGPLDLQSSLDKLAQLCRNDDHMEDVLASLGDVKASQRRQEQRIDEVATGVSDVLAGVRELLRFQELDRRGLCRIEIPILDSTVCLSGQKEDVVKLAEDIILKVLRSAVNKVEDPNDDNVVKFAVRQFLSDIERKDVVVESAESGSIIVKIRCSSLKGLAKLLSIFNDDGRCRLPGIEVALYTSLQEEMDVELVLPHSTTKVLQTFIGKLQDHISSRMVPYKNRSYDAMVISVDSDLEALKKLIDVAEDTRGLKLFVPDRDVPPGCSTLDITWTQMFDDRCKRMIVLISKDFMRSGQFQFAARVADDNLFRYDSYSRIIPVRVDDCEVPRPFDQIRCFKVIDGNWNIVVESMLAETDTYPYDHTTEFEDFQTLRSQPLPYPLRGLWPKSLRPEEEDVVRTRKEESILLRDSDDEDMHTGFKFSLMLKSIQRGDGDDVLKTKKAIFSPPIGSLHLGDRDEKKGEHTESK